MDPMAGLGGGAGAAADTVGEGRSIFNGQSAQKNMMAISDVRQFLAILAGAAAGVLGLTSWQGGVFFLATHVGVGGAVLYGKMAGDVKRYTGRESKVAFATDGIQATSLSFMLFWTLFYGLVYLF